MKKIIPVLIAVFMIIVIAVIGVGARLMEKYSYSKERADLTEYFEEREGEKMLHNTKGREKLLTIWRRQNRRCPVCGEPITSETGFKVHTPAGKGAKKIMVHAQCHEQIHTLNADSEPGLRQGGFRKA